jgi:hypothetical protein
VAAIQRGPHKAGTFDPTTACGPASVPFSIHPLEVIVSSSTNPEAATVARTQQAKGGYDVYEVVEATDEQVIRALVGLDVQDSSGTRIPSNVAVLVHIGVYKGQDPQLACWRAAEDVDAPFALHERAKGQKPPVLVAGTTGRGGLSSEKPYGLEPDPRFRRRSA